MTVAEWLRQAAPGARKTYHTGHLCEDRMTDAVLDGSAHEWMRASEAGLVELHLSRGPDGRLVYWAIRTAELSE